LPIWFWFHISPSDEFTLGSHVSFDARIVVTGLARMRAERISARIPSTEPSLRLDDASSAEHRYFQTMGLPPNKALQ
jgi:hypothetical protein